MTAIHTEKAFEEHIEDHLVSQGGWLSGSPSDFDRSLGLVPKDLFAFIQANQPALWTSLLAQHKSSLEPSLLDSLSKALEARGSLDVLRHGFKFFGKTIELACFKPAHSLNPETVARYGLNRLVVIRQVRFIPQGDESIDMVLFLNGLPIATVELKNHLSGQTVRDAILQYKKRDPKHTIYRFKRGALVHFAVDPDLVYMTTRLQGDSTFFLPFNQGCDGGAGNPPNPAGYKTAYLWERIWQRDSFLDIVGRFVALLKEEERKPDGGVLRKEKLVFPRYHQLDAVRKLEAAARLQGAGQSYLVQHSAGSGKSNSIAWLAHRLSNLHSESDQKVFDSVVVVTDRKVLDKQLQDVVYQFEHAQGVIARIDDNSAQLADALQKATPIIITTLQKFPFVTQKIGELPERRYAVIVDEAHSSQSGEAALQMKKVLGTEKAEPTEQEDDAQQDWEDEMLKVMQARGKQGNLSFFAFTATPKAKTLAYFGTPDIEGKPEAFHLYSMRQAIEEGFILDVLQHYTTYKTYYRLIKSVSEDPRVPKKQAAKALARFMSLHPHNLAQKTEVIIEHFRHNVRARIGGKAKAMLVTSSRLHAVRYQQAFKKYLKDKEYSDIKVLVAFSGTVHDPDSGLEYTETGMNVGPNGKNISEKGLPAAFHQDDYKLLIVANKYQTGFDEPLLHTMYVDKRLSGVQAVQTLSRLNRIHPGKEDTFVLDFVNDAEEIQRSFQPYYQASMVDEMADPNTLYDHQHQLDNAQVYYQSEVDAYCKIFYTPDNKLSKADQARLTKHLDPAVHRYRALAEDARQEFRNRLKGFVSLYAFLSQIMPFVDADLEKLYSFGRHLLSKLSSDDLGTKTVRIDGDVALKYYRLQKLSEGAVVLTVNEPVGLRGPTALGTAQAKELEVPLSELIDVLNERFGTDFSKADQLLFDAVVQGAKDDEDVVEKAKVNELDNFSLAMQAKLEELMVQRLERNDEIVSKYLTDRAFREVINRELAKRAYEEIRGESGIKGEGSSAERD